MDNLTMEKNKPSEAIRFQLAKSRIRTSYSQASSVLGWQYTEVGFFLCWIDGWQGTVEGEAVLKRSGFAVIWHWRFSNGTSTCCLPDDDGAGSGDQN